VKSVAVVGLLFTASLAAACSAPKPSASEAPPVAVSVGAVKVTEVAVPFEAGGIIRARTAATIASRIMAPIAAVHVRPGDRVRRGAALVTLDGRDIQANNARASAALISATETARAAEAETRAAQSSLVLARATHERISSLQAKRSATMQELDQAVAGLTAAEAQHAGADAHSAAANAARDAARAAAESAAINATYTVLTAPFDGVVTERNADPGSMAMPGSPLLTLEEPSAFRLEVQLDEGRAALVALSQGVETALDNTPSGRDAFVRGHVVEIARVDPTSHSFIVKIDVPAASGLRSGLFGRARFAGPVRETLTVPASAVVRRGQLTFAFTVDANGLAHLRPISCGITDGERVEILSGLHEADVVVTSPPPALSDGSHVAKSGGR
jgi:multidrug efflux pump subunit AcrA (membrane-fusion protein)